MFCVTLNTNVVQWFCQQKHAQYVKNQMKTLKARNEYLLAIDGANAALEKYFIEDLPLLIEVRNDFRF